MARYVDIIGKDVIYMTDSEAILPPERDLYLSAFSNWQFGQWGELVKMEVPITVTGSIKTELLMMKACAHIQLGNLSAAKKIVETLAVNRKLVLFLLSSSYNTLGRCGVLINRRDRAREHFFKAVEVVHPETASVCARWGRAVGQSSQLGTHVRWECSEGFLPTGKRTKLFIDCGGYDGCSVIKFKLMNPDFDVVSFEANPELWHYYDFLPSELIKKAVFHYDGNVEFRLDPVDADGSSLIKEKEIDFRKTVKNEDCPVVRAECVDLSSFVREKSKFYDVIHLKLDVEGAEYLILDKMIEDGTLRAVDRLYAEFHWNKIGMAKERHDQLVEDVARYTDLCLEEWDAQEFAVHKRDVDATRRRLMFHRILGG